MIREEAIEILADKVKPCLSGTDWNDAIDMAIKALEQEPTDKNFTKADIDAIVKALNAGWELRVNEVLDKLRAEIKGKIEQEEFARSVFRHEEKDTANAEQCTGSIFAYKNVIKLIDKYKAETEDT